jgi:photosystem II stability/assembly factor-like uncharacterized protein
MAGSVLVVLAVAVAAVTGQTLGPPGVSERLYSSMRWRLIGPSRGGRVLAVSGVAGQPNVYYFGAVGGGVWKTTNGGRTWGPVFDAQPVASIGALAVSASNPDIIYVGTGEADMRSDISFGDGVYKSTDAGKTWTSVGLRDTRQIGRVLIDPRNSDTVLVAALGHAYGPNPERGVFRTADGGKTWSKVLYKDENTGAIDLAFDPDNPRIVYAALWNTRRPPWSNYAPISGPGSGLYRSTDGGVTWAELGGRGLPSEQVGRIGIAVAAGQGGRRVYALIDTKACGLYRSDDGGESWERASADPRLSSRAWYFSGVTIDPRDPDTVYVANVALYRSTDGGRSFGAIKGAPGGDDYHLLWIAPEDPRRMIVGSDQGATISVDRGRTWSSWNNQPTAQFYHVSTDNRYPYYVYGAQQDSGTAAVASRGDYGRITSREWYPVGAGESGYVFPDPADPDIVYGGSTDGELYRFARRTGQVEDVSPWPDTWNEGDISTAKYRYPWTPAVAFSPFPPRAIYQGAQVLFRTVNAGRGWTVISPDLTKNTSHRAAAAATMSENESRAETSGVIYTVAPSPVARGQIWVGTDTGLVQLTRDEGKTWRNVTPEGLPAWSKISIIDASPFDPASAYAAVDRHEADDLKPYIYGTRDYGKTWKPVTTGLAEPAYVHVVRADPLRKGLLFAGTELGVAVSFDDGERWQPLQLNLPVTSIRDLVVKNDDLVVATHGRSFWILDDITPLRQIDDAAAAADVYLFKPAVAIRVRASENRDTPLLPETATGENPPAGAVIDYSLASVLPGDVVLEIRDGTGKLVRRFSSRDQTSDTRPRNADEATTFARYWLHVPPALPKRVGMNRFVWDLRYPKPPALFYEYSIRADPEADTPAEPEGPLVLPGVYQVTLTAAGRSCTEPLTVKQDPRVNVPLASLSGQLSFQMTVGDGMKRSFDAFRQIDAMRRQLKEIGSRLESDPNGKQALASVRALDERAQAVGGRDPGSADPDVGFALATGSGQASLATLNSTFAALATIVSGADAAPTLQAREMFREGRRDLDAQLAAWSLIRSTQIPNLNRTLRERGLPAITIGDGER